MTRDEYVQELQDLADSTDDHVTAEDALVALVALAERVKSEGFH